MIQKFEIPGRLPNANDQKEADGKGHGRYRPGNDLKRETQDLIGWSIVKAKIKPVKSRIYVHFTWVEPNMRRDMDNIVYAHKYIFDALRETHIIKNDGWRYIAGFSDRFFVNKNNPRVIVELEEVQDQ